MFMVQSLRLWYVRTNQVELSITKPTNMTLYDFDSPHDNYITNDFIIAYVLGLPLFSYTSWQSQ